MTRRAFLSRGMVCGGATLGVPAILRGRFSLYGQSRKTYSARTIEVIGRAAVLDMLGLLTLDWAKLDSWQQRPSSFTQADFLRLKQSGINVFHPAVEPNLPDPFLGAQSWIGGWNEMISQHPAYLLRVDTPSGIARARDEQKIGIVIGFQNSDHFRNKQDVAFFHRAGQRVSQLTYNTRNALGSGCVEPFDRGLSPFGGEIITEMNRTGMAVDISHAGERTALDAVSASRVPVMISHANCRSLVPHHPRCVSDELIQAMAAKGGVIGITDVPSFVWYRRPVTIDHLLDHYEHVARLVGVEHVGIGSDSDLDGFNPKRPGSNPHAISGLNLASRIFDVTEGLFRRGYSEKHLELILGGNFARVLGSVWHDNEPVQASA